MVLVVASGAALRLVSWRCIAFGPWMEHCVTGPCRELQGSSRNLDSYAATEAATPATAGVQEDRLAEIRGQKLSTETRPSHSSRPAPTMGQQYALDKFSHGKSRNVALNLQYLQASLESQYGTLTLYLAF